jgi:nitrate/TMAO reductase-like tetraheme cytochrome c subunit
VTRTDARVTDERIGAAARVLYSAAALQQSHVTPSDSVLVESPLPGGVAAVVRFLMNAVPTWVQFAGLAIGIVVGAFVVRRLYVRRRDVRAWFVSRSRAAKVGLGAAGVVVLAAASGAGAVTWNYTQHANEFCTGCHVMKPAFQRFMSPENKHNELSCHDCHQQSMYASGRQMYLWLAERPEEIGEHAKVPNRVCETCHVTGDTATWQHIKATAGHRVHLESDSSALRDVQCVTCHGVEVHRFKPVSETCGQSGCHKPDETRIVLGKMSEQTVLHCAACHGFTADVPALATPDSARGTLRPGEAQCLGCHAMQQLLPDFDAARDPHDGKCGSCHNAHTQRTPAAAAQSCATSGCHADWRNEPFHTGANHRRVGETCVTCHVPHQAKVDASDCQACHVAVRARGALRPPLTFDTTRALRRGDTLDVPDEPPMPFVPDDSPATPGGDDERERAMLSLPPPDVQDTFPHARHAKVACLSCHVTGTGRGRLTFEAPRGCAICHHQAPTPDGCAACHRPEDRSAPVQTTLTVSMSGRAPRPRPVDFFHARHETRLCTECHTTPVTLAAEPSKAQCADCHTEHHESKSTCASCHRVTDPGAEHRTLSTAHERCDACHTATTIARLTPARAFCATCHSAQATGHYDARECTTCHFLAEPGAYRAKLITAPPR